MEGFLGNMMGSTLHRGNTVTKCKNLLSLQVWLLPRSIPFSVQPLKLHDSHGSVCKASRHHPDIVRSA